MPPRRVGTTLMSAPNTCERCHQPIREDAAFGVCPCRAGQGLQRALAEEDPPETDSELERRQVGDYRILRKIGEGGFGVVFLATHAKPVHWRVALKVLKRGVDSAGTVKRFSGEQKALSLMDHPNVATIFDGGITDDGLPFFVMEYIEGEDIKKFCRQHALGIEERLKLFIQVCRGVHHAHQKGVIHRDIKPSNVMVSSEDGAFLPKVIDFGIAKAVTRDLDTRSMVTRPNQLIGTLPYISPEQAVGSSDIDVTSDVYSLGALFYELLTGVYPIALHRLRSGTPEEALRAICEVVPEKPSSCAAGIEKNKPNSLTRLTKGGRRLRGDIDWIVMMALSKERERRYESAEALAEDLERHLSDLPVVAKPQSHWYLMRKFARRHRAAAAASVAVAATLVIASTASFVMYLREDGEKQELDAVLAATAAAEKRIGAENQQADEVLSLSLGGLFDALQKTDDVNLLGQIAETALDHYTTTTDEDILDIGNSARLFLRIGDILHENGESGLARRASEQAEKEAEIAGSDPDRLGAAIAIAEVDYDNGRIEDALAQLMKLEKEFDEKGDPDSLEIEMRRAGIEMHRLISDLRQERAEIPLAIASSQKAETLLDGMQTQDRRDSDLAQERKRIADLLLLQGEFKKARNLAQSALEAIPDSNSREGKILRAEIHAVISETFEEEKNIPSAVSELTTAANLMSQLGEIPKQKRKWHGMLESRLAGLCELIHENEFLKRSEAYRQSAIWRWQDLLEEDPNDADLRTKLAWEYHVMCQQLGGQERYFEPYRRDGSKLLNELSGEEGKRLQRLFDKLGTGEPE